MVNRGKVWTGTKLGRDLPLGRGGEEREDDQDQVRSDEGEGAEQGGEGLLIPVRFG